MKITIILGAGASKAYEKLPYPLLNKMLKKMLKYASQLYFERLPEEDERRILFSQEKMQSYLRTQRLYLSYSLMKALRIKGPNFEKPLINDSVIDRQFEIVLKKVDKKDISIADIFAKFKTAEKSKSGYRVVTKAYWALAHAISFYMLQMIIFERAQAKIGYIDNAHVMLLKLISQFLERGVGVNVVDFNYDCLLERGWCDLVDNRTFGWDYGRERKVFKNDDFSLSDLARMDQIEIQNDGKRLPLLANIIKPHGDMCTFLRGTKDIFYRGGRHIVKDANGIECSIFPKALTDINKQDKFVRSSIVPPSGSKLRFRSSYYKQEQRRLKLALTESEIFIIIGWSASGTDRYYQKVFRPIFNDPARTNKPRLFVITKTSDFKECLNLHENLKNLFGRNMKIDEIHLCGFNESSVDRLGKFLFLTS